jgi:HD-GYP domain-containing protein (c-di-GMP phosphodiesterase class II)
MSEASFNVLAVDDDPGILEIYREILALTSAPAESAEGHPPPRFQVACCTQAEEAVETVRGAVAAGASFSTVFLDVNLPPGRSGTWAAEKIVELDSAANIVLVTGYIGTELGRLPRHLALSQRMLFLEKPFHPREILQFALALSAKWQAERQVRELNANLEGLVQARTAELKQSNTRLRWEARRRLRAQNQLQESFENLRRTIGGAVLAIARTVEKRDPYTSGHQQRVAELSRAIGRELGLGPDELEGLFIAAVIHDIGKISLPAEILSKPSQLNSLEMSLVQGHAQAGYDILRSVEFPWPVARIVLQHHERIDGSGYPQMLVGDEILLQARIVGVADVVETMASHRPYRPSIGMDKALDEIETHRGIRYDADVVDACLSLMRTKHFELPTPVFP